MHMPRRFLIQPIRLLKYLAEFVTKCEIIRLYIDFRYKKVYNIDCNRYIIYRYGIEEDLTWDF